MQGQKSKGNDNIICQMRENKIETVKVIKVLIIPLMLN